MKYLLGQKIGMSQVFDSEGNVIPVTWISVAPNIALMARTKEKDGYSAVQVGTGVRAEKNIAKAQRSHFKDLGNFRYVKEFRLPEGAEAPARGETFDIGVLSEGDRVRVSGISKAKGFQGVVKRHGFHGAPATHGTKHAHREPGSIGGGGRAGGRVIKGMRMAGRMGGDRVTVRDARVIKVDTEHHAVAITGAVPGSRGTLIEIRG